MPSLSPSQRGETAQSPRGVRSEPACPRQLGGEAVFPPQNEAGQRQAAKLMDEGRGNQQEKLPRCLLVQLGGSARCWHRWPRSWPPQLCALTEAFCRQKAAWEAPAAMPNHCLLSPAAPRSLVGLLVPRTPCPSSCLVALLAQSGHSDGWGSPKSLCSSHCSLLLSLPA